MESFLENNSRIDINVDLGEGFYIESKLMPYISSCNIACGSHAGNVTTMRRVVSLAKQYNVKVGAHPSFPDRENFGRLPMKLSEEALYTSLKNQLNALLQVLKTEQVEIHHIKPHGALYNMAAVDLKTANVVVKVLKSIGSPIKLYVPYHSIIATVAIENNIEILYEAFADRNYNDDLSLVSREQKNALIIDKHKMFTHVYEMITNHKVTSIKGNKISIKADTICIHGDNTNAENLVKYLRIKLEGKGIKVL